MKNKIKVSNNKYNEELKHLKGDKKRFSNFIKKYTINKNDPPRKDSQ